jgi:hypothetical protein
MSAGATTERVLIALRHLLASRVEPGTRLDPPCSPNALAPVPRRCAKRFIS